MEAGRSLRLAERGGQAAQCYEAVLKMAGERLVPIRYLRLAALEAGDVPRTASLCIREARAAQDVINQATLFGEAGKSFRLSRRNAML